MDDVAVDSAEYQTVVEAAVWAVIAEVLVHVVAVAFVVAFAELVPLGRLPELVVGLEAEEK